MANEKRLIDANDAVRMLRGKCIAKYPSTFLMGLLASADEISKMSPLDAVEVVHAHWEDGWGVNHVGEKTYDSIDCSHCNEIFKIESHDREYWKNRFKVCPFCGAVMDGERREGE